jgi:1-pyrroline-5-carboxylate dehydrogenase
MLKGFSRTRKRTSKGYAPNSPENSRSSSLLKCGIRASIWSRELELDTKNMSYHTTINILLEPIILLKNLMEKAIANALESRTAWANMRRTTCSYFLKSS